MEPLSSRSSYWDNAKAILMFLVVVGHYYAAGFVYSGLSGGKWAIPQAVVSFIYMFHMPLFAFISGYFSKNTEKQRRRSVTTLLLPYLVFNTLCILMDHFLKDAPVYNPFFYPFGQMWYLIALFLWRQAAVWLEKLRYSWLWALGFSLFCSAFVPGKDWTLLANCITFLPFFLLGLSVSPKQLQALRKLPRWLCGAVLAVVFLATLAAIACFGCTGSQLGFFATRFSPNLDGLPHLAVTVLRYGLALVLGACMLRLIPGSDLPISAIGRNTMTILLLHNLPGIRELLYALAPWKGSLVFSLVWWTGWSAAATLLFGTARAGRVYERCMVRCRTAITGLMTKGSPPEGESNADGAQ